MLKFLFARMFYIDLWIAGGFITAKLPRRNRFPLRAAAAAAFCVLFSCFWSALFDNSGGGSPLTTAVSFLGSFFVVVAGICLCVKISGWSILFIGSAMWFIQHFSSDVEKLLFGGNWMDMSSFLRHLVLITAVSAVGYALFFRKLDDYVLRRIDLKLAAPVWAVMCLACLLLGTHAGKMGEDNTSFMLMDLLCTSVGLLYQSSLYHFCGLAREKDGVQKLLEESEVQYAAAKRNVELINVKCHDLRHMIQYFRLQGRVDDGVFAEMEQAVREYDSGIQTGNPALDVILTEKSAECAALGIGFTCMAEAEGLQYIQPVDLYVLFGNALENAIEATQRLEDPEKKQISLTVRRTEELYSIHLQNYTSRAIQLIGDVPLTEKEDKQNHGFGVKSMRLLTEKYEGEIHFRQEGDVVELYLLLPCRMAGPD